MYSVVLLMAATTGGEVAEACRGGCRAARGCAVSCGGCGCYVACGGCARPARGRAARGCGGCVSYGCGGCVSYSCGGCAVSYAPARAVYSGCAAVSYSAPVTYSGCATYSAPVHHSAPVTYSGCAMGHPIGGHVYSGSTTVGGYAGVIPHSGSTSGYAGVISNSSSGTIVASGDTTTAESDELKPGTTLSTTEETMLKEMMDAEKSETEKKKLEEEFRKDTRAGRKATYEVYKKNKSSRDDSTAMIIVTVPANATVKIDGQSTTSTSTIRRFQSPSLTTGKSYSYTFEAEYVQDGTPVKVAKKVSFTAGSGVRLDLSGTETAVARK